MARSGNSRLRAGRIVGIVQNQHLDAIRSPPAPHPDREGIRARQAMAAESLLSTSSVSCNGTTDNTDPRMQRRLPLEHQHRKQRRQSIDCALHRKQLRPQSSSTSVRIAIPMLGRLQKLGFAVERRIPRVRGVDGLGDVTDEIRRKGVGLPFARSVTSAAARDGGNDAVPVGEAFGGESTARP